MCLWNAVNLPSIINMIIWLCAHAWREPRHFITVPYYRLIWQLLDDFYSRFTVNAFMNDPGMWCADERFSICRAFFYFYTVFKLSCWDSWDFWIGGNELIPIIPLPCPRQSRSVINNQSGWSSSALYKMTGQDEPISVESLIHDARQPAETTLKEQLRCLSISELRFILSSQL